MSSTYYQVPADRIVELRKVADSLRDMQELNALCLLYGMRSMQACDEELVECGEITPNELPNKQNCEERGAEFIHDMVCREEMLEVARVNDLGDYSLKVVPVVTLVKSI